LPLLLRRFGFVAGASAVLVSDRDLQQPNHAKGTKPIPPPPTTTAPTPRSPIQPVHKGVECVVLPLRAARYILDRIRKRVPFGLDQIKQLQRFT